jgi:CubicO group peptidase (beta-lactamase class C family)
LTGNGGKALAVSTDVTYSDQVKRLVDAWRPTGRNVVLFLVGAALASCCVCLGEGPPKESVLCVTTAEEQGMDSAVLSRGLSELAGETKHLHSLLIARNGCLVVEAYWVPYNRERKHYLNSATKAVLSALVGIAVHDRRLREGASVLSDLPAYGAADGDPRRRSITVRDLLTMSSGISWHQSPPDNTSDEMGRSANWVRFILERPMAADPGKITNYSNGDSHLLSAALQNAVGKTALEFARKRLFTPLGIQDVAWDHDPQQRSIGSAALQMRSVDMVKIGFLYLRGGQFGGRRILERGWVERSLGEQAKMPAKGGPVAYGYYWWLYPERHVAEAWGGAGQRIAVIRDLKVVVVMTADDPGDYPRSPFAARIYDLVRASVKSSGRLPPSPAAVELAHVLAGLTAR